jgi:hypothetical protein
MISIGALSAITAGIQIWPMDLLYGGRVLNMGPKPDVRFRQDMEGVEETENMPKI